MPFSSVDTWFLDRVRSEQARLRSYIRALGVRTEAVDDLAQEALVVALSKLDEFDRRNDFGIWVRQIARRLVANELRKATRRNQILSEHVTELLLGTDLGPETQQERQEELAALRECLALLPRHSRELLHQRYFEDLSPGAISSRLGRTSNQVRQALLRLRRLLLGCIERRIGSDLA